MTRTVLLGDSVDISSSKRIFYNEYVNSGIPFYRSKEIIEKAAGKKDISTELFISEERFDEIESKFGSPKEGDLLLTSVGTLGIPYLVQKDEKFYFKDGNLTWFRNFKPELNQNYLLYWLTSQSGKNELLNHTIGSTQKALTIQGLKKVRVPLPNIETQEKIADILGMIDEKIEMNRKMNETLEDMGQALFKKYFITNPEAKSVLLGSLISETSNRVGSGDNGIYKVLSAVKTGELVDSESYFKKQVFSKDISKYKKVSMNEFAYNPARVNIGSIGRLDRNIKGAVSPVYVSFKTQEGYQYAISELLKTETSKRRIVDLCSGTVRQILRYSDFCKLKAYKIDESTLQQFNDQYEVFINLKEQNYKEIEALTELRDSLLPRLISGKIKL